MKIAYVDLIQQHQAIKGKILEALDKILTRGNFILGEEVEEFETRFAAYCGTKYAIGVNSGTDALFLALKTYGMVQAMKLSFPQTLF